MDERYEVIDGELYVTHAPSWRHQFVSSRLGDASSTNWSDETEHRHDAFRFPASCFRFENAVIPDVVWIELRAAAAGYGSSAVTSRSRPKLVDRDPVARFRATSGVTARPSWRLYSREGVDEYWIVDMQRRTVDVYPPGWRRRLAST